MSTASHPKPPVWKLDQEIGRDRKGEGELRKAKTVAVFENGVMAVSEFDLKKVYLFNSDGTYKATLQSNSSNPTEKLKHPKDVAVTSKENLVVVDSSNYAKIFTINGSFISSINTLTPDEDPNTVVRTNSVAVTCNDEIVIGDGYRQLLTVHSEVSGWLPNKISLDLRPVYLSTNGQGHILVTGRKVKGKPDVVKALTTSDQEVYTLDAFMVDGKVGSPQGSVCDERGYVYIAVMVFDESNGNVNPNTGHIHQYDHMGTFMKCIIQGIYRPHGPAISKSGSDLYVANQKSVLKYSAT